MSGALGEAALGELELGDVDTGGAGLAVRTQPTFVTVAVARSAVTATVARTRLVAAPANSSVSVPAAVTFAVFYSEGVTSSG